MVFSISRPLEITTDMGANDTMSKRRTPGKPSSRRSNKATKALTKSGDPKGLRFTALYAAGRAVSAIVLGMNLDKVFIKQCPTTGVSVSFTELVGHHADDLAGKGGEAVMPHLIQSVAGLLVEIKENPAATKTFAFALDHEAALNAAVLAICELTDMGDGTMGATAAEQKRKEASLIELFNAAVDKAMELLAEHWDAVLEVADLLCRKKALSGYEVAAIVNGA
jgi:hypothetical protein